MSTFYQNLRDAELAMPRLLKEAIQKAPLLLQAYAEENFHLGARPGKRNETRKLYVNSGKLAASLIKNRRGNISKLTLENGRANLEWGSSLPYAAIHEYGGRAGRNLAAAIPARPYINPAFRKFEEEGLKQMQEQILTEITAILSR